MNNLLCVSLLLLFALGVLLPVCGAAENGDSVFADFEGADYGAWKVEGTAFGNGPAQGTLPGQMPVAGFAGHGLASSFYGNDEAQGRLISPEFVIQKRYITFLVGGGGYAGKTCINLIVGGKVLRTATGPNVHPGGSENLALSVWDVRELRSVAAHIEIVDAAQGSWGHINVDQIVFTDTEPARAPKPFIFSCTRRVLGVFALRRGFSTRASGLPGSPVGCSCSIVGAGGHSETPIRRGAQLRS